MGSDAIARLRKAVDNQAALGEGEFRLPIMDMCRLVQRASEEAGGADLPVDADGKSVPLGTATLYRHDGSALAVDCYMRDPADGDGLGHHGGDERGLRALPGEARLLGEA